MRTRMLKESNKDGAVDAREGMVGDGGSENETWSRRDARRTRSSEESKREEMPIG